MKKFVLIVTTMLASFTAEAQDTPSVKKDNLSFIKSKRMSDADLAKKREGTFITGLPDTSSDPVTDFGFGVRTNVIWNGKRDNELFAYTPYLMKLKANAASYTSNARELALSLDVPYYKGTHQRFKIDFRVQQNPTNLYFGITEKTLGDLRLPSDENMTFSTYGEFDRARKILCQGGIGEETFVTDTLSNRFRETKYMLNLKADYALGNGKWQIMGGYEIQHLNYKTFEGMEADAIDPVTGNNIKAPNGISLLRRDFEQGLVSGVDGGWVSLIQNALIYDTRDFEPDPTKGTYFEIANEYSSKLIGSQFDFNKLLIQGRYYQKLPFGPRTVLASRVGIGNIFGKNAPFFEYQDQWSPEGSINAMGGKASLRGYRVNRFLARSMWFANFELRTRLAETNLWKQYLSFAAAPFFDMGTVRDRRQDLNFQNVKYSYGAGLRIS